MIIKIIPETEAEIEKHQEIEYTGVKEYFVMGNHKDEDGHVADFHEWEGSYKYLMTSLNWYHMLIDDERQNALIKVANKTLKTAKPTKQPFVKTGEVREQKIQVLERPNTPEENAADEAFEAQEKVAEIPQLSKIFETQIRKPIQFELPKQKPNMTLSAIDKEEIDKIAAKLSRPNPNEDEGE